MQEILKPFPYPLIVLDDDYQGGRSVDYLLRRHAPDVAAIIVDQPPRSAARLPAQAVFTCCIRVRSSGQAVDGATPAFGDTLVGSEGVPTHAQAIDLRLSLRQ